MSFQRFLKVRMDWLYSLIRVNACSLEWNELRGALISKEFFKSNVYSRKFYKFLIAW